MRRLYRLTRALVTGKAYVIPYRYRKGDKPPVFYPSIDAVYQKANNVIGEHLALLDTYRDRLAAIKESAPAPEPRWDQDWFAPLDAAIYYSLIRHYAPKHIIEIGSGHSTRFAAQAVRDGKLPTEFDAIDPAPRADFMSLPIRWSPTIVQNVEPSFFAKLGDGDILFIDSSHILMPGSDLDYLLNAVLPALGKGVLVHFHDIFLPAAYPKDWQWRGYNEQQAITGLLFSETWQVLFSSRHALHFLQEKDNMLAILQWERQRLASSLWLRKTN